MEQKIAIITGANGGMGATLVRDVANAGYHVVMACRDLGKATPVYEQLKQQHPDQIQLKKLDLASLESIKKFANEIQEEFQHIDLLLNNAGTLCH